MRWRRCFVSMLLIVISVTHVRGDLHGTTFTRIPSWKITSYEEDETMHHDVSVKKKFSPIASIILQRSSLDMRGGHNSCGSLTKKYSVQNRIRSWLRPKSKYKRRHNQGLSKYNDESRDRNSSSSINIVYDPLAMYTRCLVIVTVWILIGTLFYSYTNNWPLPQSFFYAVDAGMSIGFCTAVHETKLISKAFTILYILLGASVVSGALSIFLQDSLESLSSPTIEEYQLMIERNIFAKADVDHTGELTFEQFQTLLDEVQQTNNSNSNIDHANGFLSPEDIQRLWKHFDRLQDGVIHLEEFTGTFRSIESLIQSLHAQSKRSHPLHRLIAQVSNVAKRSWSVECRIYSVCCFWIGVGITWGIVDQHWDPITATHFAISALATGGLTAPSVNEKGILPAEPSIFCGIYCLFGIPLFALTLAHYAKVLVAGYVTAMEKAALTRPLSSADYDLATHLTTTDKMVHLSDFIVLQLLRQGKISRETIQVLKERFEQLDTNGSGTLTLNEATTVYTPKDPSYS